MPSWGDSQAVKAARQRANALGFPDVRAAVKHYLTQGQSDKEIAERLGLSRNAVRYHRRVLSQPGAEDVAFGFAPKVYRAVINGMCEDWSSARIAEELGMTEAQVRRYVDEINASGLFKGLECESCPLADPCHSRARRYRRALCELTVKIARPPERVKTVSVDSGWADAVFALVVDPAALGASYE